MVAERLPFGADFQRSLLRLLCDDNSFAHTIADHLQPQYFENEIFAWAFAAGQRYKETYGRFPSLRVLREQTSLLDSRVRAMYSTAIEQIETSDLRDEEWMRAQTLEFVKRSIFARTYQETRGLYNAGKTEEAYDLMMQRMEQLSKTAWTPEDESDYYDTFAARQDDRMSSDPAREAVGTGFPSLDVILHGGLSLGELGIWVAYAKHGKSTMLVQHGLAATRLEMRNTAHFVFEGSRKQVENRYDAAFMDEFYSAIRIGDCDAEKYSRAWSQAQALKGLLRIRGFTDSWDYSVLDIHEAMRSWKRNSGWEPSVIIVDYGDLLSGREKNYPNETAKQQAAFRDLKTLANRGFAVWTASQAQRPSSGSEDKEHLIYARQIADAYAKVRVADFLGSVNSTREERRAPPVDESKPYGPFQPGRARLFAELYRDNAADKEIPVVFDGAKMRIYEPNQLGYLYDKPAGVSVSQQLSAGF